MIFCTCGFLVLGGLIVLGEGVWRVVGMRMVPTGGVEYVGTLHDSFSWWEEEQPNLNGGGGGSPAYAG